MAIVASLRRRRQRDISSRIVHYSRVTSLSISRKVYLIFQRRRVQELPSLHRRSAYETIVAAAIPNVLQGGSCSFFAYGHSGSGKTHTIVGYDYEDGKQLGLCLAAAKRLFDALEPLNAQLPIGKQLGLEFTVDLLNGRAECHIREGYDGKTHIRGETEKLDGGKVRVRPIVKRPCWDFDKLRRELIQAMGKRVVSSSSVHDLSSRTYAVLELEIVNQELEEAREVVV
ncbi:unnamed protein product [Clonostachys byssicola]|uniref:Kinesin motor domain-containing protein n=1 Tax=Clonostachys byssicola TaxID=160290 RepID=A0A9N9UP78_9HYPO|nr:unnamed protein product [Clonostachys byssicola]